MKTASPQLIALLNNSVTFKIADLLLIKDGGFTGGAYLGLCSADFPINDGTYNYQAAGTPLVFERSRTTLKAGLSADSMDVTLYGSYTFGTIPFQQAVGNGLLDGARVQVQKVFMPEWGDTTPGFLWVFSGRVSDVELSRNEVRLIVKSDLELLDRPFPRNLYQPGCTNDLFGPGCGVNRASFITTTSVTGGASTRSVVNFTNAQASTYFDKGTIQFTSGQNNGAKRTIKTHTNGSPSNVSLALPLPYAPLAGDTFEIVPGCDKTKPGGCTKFGNTARYRGCRFIPRPEAAR